MTDDVHPTNAVAPARDPGRSDPGVDGVGPTALRAAALPVYLAIVALHFVEHLLQMAQIHLAGWPAHEAGGALGLFLPALLHSEALHFGYNLFQLLGLVLLRRGFGGAARWWWTVALGAQAWHFFEHVQLQVQYLSGHYLFGAEQQTSIGQLLVPRPELHTGYNLIVVALIGVGVYLQVRRAAWRRQVDELPGRSRAPGVARMRATTVDRARAGRNRA